MREDLVKLAFRLGYEHGLEKFADPALPRDVSFVAAPPRRPAPPRDISFVAAPTYASKAVSVPRRPALLPNPAEERKLVMGMLRPGPSVAAPSRPQAAAVAPVVQTPAGIPASNSAAQAAPVRPVVPSPAVPVRAPVRQAAPVRPVAPSPTTPASAPARQVVPRQASYLAAEANKVNRSLRRNGLQALPFNGNDASYNRAFNSNEAELDRRKAELLKMHNDYFNRRHGIAGWFRR